MLSRRTEMLEVMDKMYLCLRMIALVAMMSSLTRAMEPALSRGQEIRAPSCGNIFSLKF